MTDLPQTLLDTVRREARRLRTVAERALAQTDPARWNEAPGEDQNGLAVLVKHVAGNLRSRWSDFLTTDGEKPDRDRDGEFERHADDTPEALRAAWDRGFETLFAALDALRPEDLLRTVTIRGEPHGVLEAVIRGLLHANYHVGQIVQLARHDAGRDWRSLSIPRGASRRPDLERDGDATAG